jgi:hypothetical protein
MQVTEGRYSKVGGREGYLEGMVESRDEMLMEITRETGLDRMGEDEDDEEDTDDGGDAAAPCCRTTTSCASCCQTWGDQWRRPYGGNPQARSPNAAWGHPGRCWARDALMRDYEENPLGLEDDFDDLDDYLSEDHSDMDE